jgi:riboflavin synthase
MFTGIIEAQGTIRSLERREGNLDLWIESSLTPELKIDQSVAHNGVCLTVVEIRENQYRVTAVEETLRKTSLNNWQISDLVNLERALRVGDRLDGHFVQGHVDAVATCTNKEEAAGSWLFHFEFPDQFAPLMVEKGSICIDGVSLTAFGLGRNTFTVTIIPYTFAHTGFGKMQPGQAVNIEFDVLGKYFLRMQSLESSRS